MKAKEFSIHKFQTNTFDLTKTSMKINLSEVCNQGNKDINEVNLRSEERV